jgi:hypothetical protein
VKHIVYCPTCTCDVAVCPNYWDAVEVANRHDGLQAHRSTITTVFDTPLEGLL